MPRRNPCAKQEDLYEVMDGRDDTRGVASDSGAVQSKGTSRFGEWVAFPCGEIDLAVERLSRRGIGSVDRNPANRIPV